MFALFGLGLKESLVLLGGILFVWPLWRICSRAGLPGSLALLALLPWGVLVPLFVLAFADWPALRHTSSPSDQGEELVHQAAMLDQAGEWDQAVVIYERVLQDPRYREHHEYARNSIQRIREKQRMAKGDA